MIEFKTSCPSDALSVKSIYMKAFPQDEAETVAEVALDLMTEDCQEKVISLLAYNESTLVGHVSFSQVSIDESEQIQAWILSPLAILPEFQRKSIGTKLVDYGIKCINEQGGQLIFVYGDPNFYEHFGFKHEIAEVYQAPYKLTYPMGWLALQLSSGKLGIGRLTCLPALSKDELW